MHDLAFLITNQYQIHHFAPIARELPADPHFVIEVRDQDFDVSEALIRQHVPTAQIEWVTKRDLKQLDGRFAVIVCQTPVLPQVFLSRTLVVAQQYSLAKELYQYGVWRSLADLNLMYGRHSVERIDGFTNALAVGNPMFDRFFATSAPEDLTPPAPGEGPLQVLYLPTYGSLTSVDSVVEQLRTVDADVTVKLHHMATPEERQQLPESWKTVGSDISPVDLYPTADVVISDFSGAAFDAAYARRPLVLVDSAPPTAIDRGRLSRDDLDRTALSSLSVPFRPGRPIADLVTEARARTADDHEYRRFVDRHFVNHGTAAAACAEAIVDLLEKGPPDDFGWSQVRHRNQDLMTRNRDLHDEIRRLRSANDRLRSAPGRKLAARSERAARRTRALIARSPALERRLVDVKRGARRLVPSSRRTASVEPTDQSRPAPVGEAVTPWQARAAVTERLAQRAVEAGLQLPLVIVDGQPLFAVRSTDKPALVGLIRSVAREIDGLTVTVGSTDTAADRVRATDIQLAQRLELRHQRAQPSVAATVCVVSHHVATGRTVAVDPRSPKVDWTLEFGATSPTPSPPRIVNEFDGPIDVVYTWVDSSDPDWQRERERFATGGEVLPSADNDERFLDRDELRYSLRSLWMYAPFVRRVHIVTSGQVPDWLDLDDERIAVVEHRDIFPDPSDLPTFNSHAIEACLHRIPGLADHFAYFNDDFFLGREISPGDLFTRAGLPRARFAPSQYILDGEPAPDAIPTDWAAFNATSLIARDFAMRFDRKHQHVPYALTRSLLDEMERRYADEFAATRRSRFRSATDLAIPSMFAHFFAVAIGQGVEWLSRRDEYVYADTGRADVDQRFGEILQRRPTFFCLNSTLHSAVDLAEQSRRITELLEQVFPHPSPFEVSPDDG